MQCSLLIDGDVFIYRAATLSEYVAKWSDEVHTLEANFSEARAHLITSIHDMQRKLEADAVVVCLSDPGVYWRRDIYPKYKSNRAKTRKPILIPDLRKVLEETFDTKMKPRLEGDDVLGILATHPKLVPGKKVIVSIDKDMKTIPGPLYNEGRDEFTEITEEEADYWHMYQTLVGDSTDGYPGCPGVGPKKAAKILEGSIEWPKVVAAFEKAKLGEAAALIQARIARICRWTDYNFTTNEPILWTP